MNFVMAERRTLQPFLLFQMFGPITLLVLFLEQVEFLTGRYNSHLKYNLVSFKKT